MNKKGFVESLKKTNASLDRSNKSLKKENNEYRQRLKSLEFMNYALATENERLRKLRSGYVNSYQIILETFLRDTMNQR